tara:strand:+ start:17949 stop:20669 length:2721 start_codon:yes stop_codon:yes gene_type:complete
MAERLFQGNIKPAAQPLGAFVAPGKKNIAAAGKPASMPGVSQIATLQQAGTSSVAGFNKFDQIAKALGPLGKNVTSLVNKGFKSYAVGNIESGYYDELKNQQMRGMATLQKNQEAGAAEAASMITGLAKTDPIGASLLREANPWKAIGRRRALAQMAGGQISSVLESELATNAGTLAGIKPGSGALTEIKQQKTQAVLTRFGLTGSEPEAAYYVTPKLNKAWDNFTQKQSELYTQELYQSTIETTNFAVNSQVQQMATDGIVLPDGRVLRTSDPNFGAAAGYMLTMELDNGLALLGGEDRIKAMGKIKESLGALYAMGIPGIRDAIGNIRLGNRNAPLDKRPRWMDANPFELMDYTNKGLELVKENDGLLQAEGERMIRDLAISPDMGIAGITDGPELQARLAKLRQAGLNAGIRDIDKVLSDVQSENAQVNKEQYALSFEQQAAGIERFESLSPNDVSPENISGTVAEARRLAAAEPSRDERTKKFKELMGKIDRAQKDYAQLPTGAALQSNLNRYVREDLADPEIAKLKGKGRRLSFLPTGGFQLDGAAPDAKAQRYASFGREVRGLYERAIWDEFTQYRNDNPGVEDIPLNEQASLRDAAAKKVRESEQYKKLKEEALSKPPVATGSDGTPVNIPVEPAKRPAPRDAANTIPDDRAKSYVKEPVMNSYWIRDEMTNLSTAKPVSRELYNLANKAGTSTDRYLLEQLKFYPQLDPEGKFRGALQQRIERARQANTPAAANFDAATDPMGNQSYSGRSPGAWLMSMFERPAAAATLPPSLRRTSSGNQAINGNWITPSGYELVQYVTGDVTAAHDGDALIVDPEEHGGDHYHNHYEFATVAQRKRAAAAFRSAGFRVTSEVRPGDPGSHGVGRGLDVAPPLNLPRTVEAEARWSRAANAILGFTP